MSPIADDIVKAVILALRTVADENPITAVLVDLVPPLVQYVEQRLQNNQDAKAELLPVILTQADVAANLAETAKFPPESPTK